MLIGTETKARVELLVNAASTFTSIFCIPCGASDVSHLIHDSISRMSAVCCSETASKTRGSCGNGDLEGVVGVVDLDDSLSKDIGVLAAELVEAETTSAVGNTSMLSRGVRDASSML